MTSWSISVADAVAQAVERSPIVSQFEKQVRTSASHVWRDAESAWAQVKAEIVASPNNVMPVIQRIEREPQSYGELLGGRTLLLRPDAERQEAIAHVPRLGSIVYEYADSLARMEPVLREKEIAWRAALREPLPALSREALSVLNDLNQAHSLRKPATMEQSHELSLKALVNKPAWEELQSWTRDISSRLPTPDAVDRIPGLSREERSMVSQAFQAVSVAERQAQATQTQERSRVWQIEQERTYGREDGRGWER